jgi:uncharacterized protein (TIGR02145 family)
MKENLKVTRYNDNTKIPNETTNTSGWGALTTGARSEYVAAGVTDYFSDYGYLYNWYAATDSRKICPSGWHVPTDSDWNKLVKYLHSDADTTANSLTQSSSAGTLMKKNDVLWTTNSGTNTSGFSALPGGYRNDGGSFYNIRSRAFFWSATENGPSFARYRILDYFGNGDVYRGIGTTKSAGASVRCLKD